MKRVLEMDGGEGCTTKWMYLMTLNFTVRNSLDGGCLLCIFCHKNKQTCIFKKAKQDTGFGEWGMRSSAWAEQGSKGDGMILDDCLWETIFIFYFLAMSCSLWGLSSPSKDRTWTTVVKAPNPNLWTAREFLNNISFLCNYLFFLIGV